MRNATRPPLVLALMLLAAPVGAQSLPHPAGLGYGRHALAPPRHDLRPPTLGADGAPIPMPEVELDRPERDRSLLERPQSTASRHANWCRTRYRSYDGRTDTFVPSANGGRARCRSPFRR